MTIEQFLKNLQKAVYEGQLSPDDDIMVYNKFHEQFDSIHGIYPEEDSVTIEV